MAHGIRAPPKNPFAPIVPDTDENWFTYINVHSWWMDLTQRQRWLLWRNVEAAALGSRPRTLLVIGSRDAVDLSIL